MTPVRSPTGFRRINGPVDLPCIFRGMAADVDARAQRASPLPAPVRPAPRNTRGLAELFSHAVIFAGELEVESPANSFPPRARSGAGFRQKKNPRSVTGSGFAS